MAQQQPAHPPAHAARNALRSLMHATPGDSGIRPFLAAATGGTEHLAASHGNHSELPSSVGQPPRHVQRRVLLINTGGTASMRIAADGSLQCVPGYLTQRIADLEELTEPGMPRVEIKEYTPMIDSSHMEPSHWSQIAADIERGYYDYDGFVVVMGTDTMAYAASALSFMMENLGKTIVFTGSMIPFCQPYSDCRRNLLVSIIMASNSEYPEVCLFFNDRLFRAVRATKVNAYGLDAFDSPNFPPLATLATGMAENAGLALAQPRSRFRVHRDLCTRIVVLRLVPGFSDGSLLSLLAGEHAQLPLAVVLSVYGNGGCAMKDGLLALTRQAGASGVLIVAATQCVRGAVLPSLYGSSNYIEDLGIASAGDMTVEALVAKLGYIFSKLGVRSDQGPSTAVAQRVRGLLPVSLRGEVSPTEVYSQKLLRQDHTPVAPKL
eukprot:TRINITY_DN61655_c0_g1_i1.p1 TRINITY_DN61655_c0_g1~~TRINITY_DN61655_c0_g1_i1.p1  ORF type:complete len:436 (+),score=137.40 TRINITY_DN61655_c0_g1_i1:79-1386(+)